MSESKVIVITGVTHGIGRSMVDWFIKNGHQVLGCGRSKDAISALNKQYENQKGSFSVADVSDHVSVESWAKKCLTNFPSSDILINNAGICGNTYKVTWESSLAAFDSVIDINLKGTNYVVHSFIPSMLEAKRGIVINMSSLLGRNTIHSKHASAYSSSKWAIEGYSAALSKELPEPLACVSLDPVAVDTPLLRSGISAEYCDKQQKPEEWAEKACPFILSVNREHNGKQQTIA